VLAASSATARSLFAGLNLTTTTQYDYGLDIPLQIEAANGSIQRVEVGGLGRVIDIFGPDPNTAGSTRQEMTIEYVTSSMPDGTRMLLTHFSQTIKPFIEFAPKHKSQSRWWIQLPLSR
jgi:hypothetical protein